MLTEEEIANIREYWKYAPKRSIDAMMKIYESDIEMYQNRINHKREFIKLMETILDERVVS